MCDPVTISAAALFALQAGSQVAGHIGTNQAYKANQQAANYSFARDTEAINRQDAQLQAENSERSFDTAIAIAKDRQLLPGHQLPTVRQTAVDLTINPNTVLRAYRELEIRGVIETHQGTGTFVSTQKAEPSTLERQRQLDQLVTEFVARAAAAGFQPQDLLSALHERTGKNNP